MFQFLITLYGNLGTGTAASPDTVGADPYQVELLVFNVSPSPLPVFIGTAASISAAETLAAAVFATPNPSLTWTLDSAQVATSNVFNFQ